MALGVDLFLVPDLSGFCGCMCLFGDQEVLGWRATGSLGTGVSDASADGKGPIKKKNLTPNPKPLNP